MQLSYCNFLYYFIDTNSVHNKKMHTMRKWPCLWFPTRTAPAFINNFNAIQECMIVDNVSYISYIHVLIWFNYNMTCTILTEKNNFWPAYGMKAGWQKQIVMEWEIEFLCVMYYTGLVFLWFGYVKYVLTKSVLSNKNYFNMHE